LISFVGFLITIPIQIVVQILTRILQLVFLPLIQEGGTGYFLPYLVLVFAISFSSGAVIVPLLQTIKAVVYYDLRSRQEGLGLKLRDREI
jgi:hypothetical protein